MDVLIFYSYFETYHLILILLPGGSVGCRYGVDLRITRSPRIGVFLFDQSEDSRLPNNRYLEDQYEDFSLHRNNVLDSKWKYLRGYSRYDFKSEGQGQGYFYFFVLIVDGVLENDIGFFFCYFCSSDQKYDFFFLVRCHYNVRSHIIHFFIFFFILKK